MAKELNHDQQSLVIKNLGFAERLAQRFGSSIMGDSNEKCITMDDLEQDAIEGLAEAAMRFDTALGVSFETFAFIWCRKYVLRSVRKFGTPLSVPANFTDGVELMHIDAEIETVTSTYADCDDNGSPEDRIFYQKAMADEAENDAQQEMRNRIENALSGLTTKERKALSYIFALESEEKTNGEIAAELGVVQGRVSQIKERALRKMEILLTA